MGQDIPERCKYIFCGPYFLPSLHPGVILGCSKYKRGTWNTAFNRALLLASVLI